MKSPKSVIILFLLIFPKIGSAQTQFKALDTLFRSYVDGISPGLAVGVIKNGEVIYENYFGYANLEHQVKINSATRFNIASNAKQFTALCVLRLLNGGKLKLDDDIRDYLPSLYPKITDRITIAQLLSHSSGIRDVYDLWALQGKNWYELFIDNDDAIGLIESQRDLNFKPGTEYLYSNSNYILLTAIIEKVTGEKFADFAETLFKELGMPETSFLVNYMAVIPNKARPYGNWDGWKEYPLITETHGDGALFTTLRDQLQWEKIIQEGGGNFLNEPILEESQQPLNDLDITEYGYGLMFGNYKGYNYTFHDGSTGAYNATFLRYPTEKLAIVVVSNNGNVPTNYLAKKVVDEIIDFKEGNTEYPSGPQEIMQFQNNAELLGAYQNSEGTIINIIEEEGKLYRKIYQRKPTRLIWQEDNLFYYETNKDLKIAFTKDQTGQKQFTIYLSTQPPNTFKRIENFQKNNDNKNSIDGIFFNDETDTKIKIRYKGENIYEIQKNGREREGEMIFRDYIRMNSYEIKVHRNSMNEVDGLLVNNGRIKNVWFSKKQ